LDGGDSLEIVMQRSGINNQGTGTPAHARKIATALARGYPDAICALHHDGPFQLLAATILSAQCTDERVNAVTPELFRRYPTPQALAASRQADVEKIIHSLGFFRAKATSLRGMATGLVERFGGELPRTLEELVSLPGLARITPSVRTEVCGSISR
jgi:endonuclease-3